MASVLLYILKAPLPVLENYLKGTLAAPLVASKAVKMAISYRAILTIYTQALQFLERMEGEPFSIRQWIHQENKGWLFMTANALHAKSFRPLLSMWLSEVSKQLIALKPNESRRLWIVIDELDSYHYLAQLVDTLPLARKYGGCFVIGMQSYAQIQKTYGVKCAEEMFDLLNTRFFFRSRSSALAKFVAEELGTQEINQFRENLSYGADTIRDGISSGHQRSNQTLVHYVDITQLENLTCFVQLPGQLPITKLTIQHRNRSEIAGVLDEKPDLDAKGTWQPPEEERTDQTPAPPNAEADVNTYDTERVPQKTEHTEKQSPENTVPEKEALPQKKQTTQATEKSNECDNKQTAVPPVADANQKLNQDADHHHSKENAQEKTHAENTFSLELEAE